jgi:copper chaperone CopZ
MNSKYFSALFIASVLFISASSSAQNTKEQPQTSQIQTVKIKLKVSGITCSGDIKDIQKAVTELKGVADCKPVGKTAATSAFEVSFNPAVISEKEIRSKMEDTPGCDDPEARPYKVKKA